MGYFKVLTILLMVKYGLTCMQTVPEESSTLPATSSTRVYPATTEMSSTGSITAISTSSPLASTVSETTSTTSSTSSSTTTSTMTAITTADIREGCSNECGTNLIPFDNSNGPPNADAIFYNDDKECFIFTIDCTLEGGGPARLIIVADGMVDAVFEKEKAVYAKCIGDGNVRVIGNNLGTNIGIDYIPIKVYCETI